ncbi:SemiSWEET family sugar transporter [Candidatus Nitrosocosmicus arcticus]|uniref:Putative MtN3 (Sweet) Family transporter n=1 Tax=Candidatus Nitrosocosmicus arcticus TaxID=2035267 RepID=A0A557SZG1_9ARCH|nr:SemiSWEET family transporter [Candidatus Nitrosocosmicus arcticus]TVP41998.1 putative MtN3 (Sweet) Family transporter [Candidatus Nitrosocosmicus arcticus]
MIDLLLTFIGFMATCFAVSSTLPQIMKAIRTKKSDDVSIRFILILIIGLMFWVIYGIGKDDIVLILGNSAGMGLNICLLFLKVKYSIKPLKEDA